MTALGEAADSKSFDGNGDGIVTKRELSAVIQSFRAGSQDDKASAGSDLLSRAEVEAFKKAYGEELLGSKPYHR
ncbi:MAG: hypothetical protein JWO69_1602 [Thermoleophilia bacterium]|jgi:hypothetical protein|nr:hypothetical protein [Thermoleophilia bacterium]